MIIHVIDNLLPEKGGPTSVVIELAKQQAVSGQKVAVLCRVAPTTPQAAAALEHAWEGTGVRFFQVPSGRQGCRAEVRRVLDQLRPSVVHLHCTWEHILRIAEREARRRGIPTVLSTHGMFHPYPLSLKRWKKQLYLSLFSSTMFSHVAEYLALNSEEAEYISRRFGWRASVLPNGVEIERYRDVTDGSFRARVPNLGDRPYVLFVGRLHPIKGCDLLIQSFALARSQGLRMDLVFMGPDEGALGGLRALVEKLGISNYVHFVGGMFGAEKLDALAGCSIFAHRPRFEGFGIAVIEGMASSRPVLTTRNCHLELAAKQHALLLSEDEDQAFALGLLHLSRDPVSALELGTRGRQWAESNCSWTSITAATDAVYSRV